MEAPRARYVARRHNMLRSNRIHKRNSASLQLSSRARRGATFAYMIVALPVMVGFCALGVDVGRLHVAKSEAQAVADAAARYAAAGTRNAGSPSAEALSRAQAVVNESK